MAERSWGRMAAIAFGIIGFVGMLGNPSSSAVAADSMIKVAPSGGRAPAKTPEREWKGTTTLPGSRLDLKELERTRVVRAADAYLKEEPVTITAFHSPRSAGGSHDYFSEGDYWWPDPAHPNGPYIQRDGLTNPDNFVQHRHALMQMSIQISTLVAAYRITGDERYALHAIRHLRAWFVDAPTRMNPSLQYAQAIQGITTGRGIGIIDTIHLVEVARSVALLEQDAVLKGDALAAIKMWFADYLRWMTTDKKGLEEKNAANNHGTCWVMQVAAFASLLGDQTQLAGCRKRFKELLLPDQMAPDGSFPRELRRTKPYSYSLFNLDAMATICQILSTPADDLWNFTSPDGRTMRKAVEFLYPYIKDKSRWPHKPDVMYWEFWPVRCPALLFAGLAYREPKYIDLWKTLDANPTNEEVLRNLPIRQPILWVAGNSTASTAAPASTVSTAQTVATAPMVSTAPIIFTASPAKPTTPPFWSIATADSIMQRHPDFATAYWKPWTYVNGYVLYGFEMLYRSTGDRKYSDFMKRYIDQFVDQDGHLQGVSLSNLDNMMTGNTVVALYETTHDERYKTAAEQIRRAFDDYPRNSDGGFWHAKSLKGQMWIDGVFMGQMFLTRYGKSIGDSAACFDEATRQITVFARHCLKGDTGLYYHAWSEQPAKWADPQTGLSPEVWSEGLGWYALVVVETLAALPRDHPKRPEVEDIFRRLAAGLKRTQDRKSGRWFQVVDKGDRPDNWTDNSGSAMFTYALQRGIGLGLLTKKEFAPIVARGYKGIIANAKIDDQGLVDIYSACDGVGVQVDYDHYIHYKQSVNAKEAVGGFLWATAIVEKPALEKSRR